MPFMDTIIQQTPCLGVLAFIVWIFLKHLAARDEMLQRIGDSCHEVQRDAIEAMKENSNAMGQNRVALDAVNHTLKRMNGVTQGP